MFFFAALKIERASSQFGSVIFSVIVEFVSDVDRGCIQDLDVRSSVNHEQQTTRLDTNGNRIAPGCSHGYYDNWRPRFIVLDLSGNIRTLVNTFAKSLKALIWFSRRGQIWRHAI